MREIFAQPLGMSFQANQEIQGRGSEKEIHHEAILHGDAKSSHAMRNSKDSSWKENLDHLLESIVYIIYIISKLGKSGFQHFKRCAIWSWNKEVMAVWRQLRKVEEEFRIDISWCENFRIDIPWCKNFRTDISQCKNFHITLFQCKNFHTDFLRCKIFRTTFLQCKNVIVRYFTPTLLDFYLKIFCVTINSLLVISWRSFKIFRISN